MTMAPFPILDEYFKTKLIDYTNAYNVEESVILTRIENNIRPNNEMPFNLLSLYDTKSLICFVTSYLVVLLFIAFNTKYSIKSTSLLNTTLNISLKLIANLLQKGYHVYQFC